MDKEKIKSIGADLDALPLNRVIQYVVAELYEFGDSNGNTGAAALLARMGIEIKDIKKNPFVDYFKRTVRHHQ